jgi:hypothetical protein
VLRVAVHRHDRSLHARMPSRAAAVRELLKRGLAAEGYPTAAYGTKSSEYGVIGKSTASEKPISGRGAAGK